MAYRILYPSSEALGEAPASLADQAGLGVDGRDMGAEARETKCQAAITTSDLEYFRARPVRRSAKGSDFSGLGIDSNGHLASWLRPIGLTELLEALRSLWLSELR